MARTQEAEENNGLLLLLLLLINEKEPFLSTLPVPLIS